MTSFKDVFISYGRADSKEFAIKLEKRLVEAGFSVWLDLNDIPLAIDFQKYIDNSVPKAHNFLFVVSPYAINSEYCALELEKALQFNKRIIPLIHVEEISREIWQQRHPQGADDDWQQYKAEGRHSIYPNMRPAISKLNWAFFQEEKTDFEQAIQGLIGLLKTEAAYVHQHTKLLDQALTWMDYQNQTRYLLTGKACQSATDWLLSKNELVSCYPSGLHSEYICQSIKNAQNLMCQVFLSSAAEDEEVAQQIRRSLLQHAITVWTNRTDVVTGEDFLSATYRGIEEADNLIYLISPDAIESHFCRDELNYALSLNKRIIPVLVRPTNAAKIPREIRGIQYIELMELTENTEKRDYFIDESQLLQILKKDEPYHREHKELLVKALKWERQEKNPSILLKRHSLNYYSTWLEIAQQRELYAPVQLQEKFVDVSLQQSPDTTLNVFIAAAAADVDFARKLNETLQVHGQSTWFEQESLVAEYDYEEEINAGITASENIIFVLSPDAVTSKKCTQIVDYSLSLNKRILIVLYDESHTIELPERLKDVSVFDFRRQDGDFLSNFGQLYRSLESNPQYVREHTLLLIKAEEWEQKNQDDSFLLRGRTLASAEAWFNQAQEQRPQPTELQRQYIQASRELPLRRIHPLSVIGIGAATTLIVALARILELFQPAEMLAYGHLLRQRSNESQDNRFLIVKVDQASGRDLRDKTIEGKYKPGIGSIPDQALLEALEELESHNPRLIGLDFYRDFPTDPELPELAKRLETSNNLIGICKATSGEGEALAAAGEVVNSDLGGYLPISEVSREDYRNRIGFNDVLDDGNFTTRRHYLVKAADAEYCDVQSAFSLVLARRYLEKQGSSYTSPLYEQDGMIQVQPNGMKVNQVTVPQLRAGGRAGGLYFDSAKLAGYQTLLNFRVVDGEPQKFAPVVTFKDVLAGKFEPEQVRDRIVLIGYTDLSDNNTDSWNTPFNEMSGVMLHGQMASQLISAALDGRPLIWWLPMGGEFLWIFSWSVVGGFIVWGFYRPLPFALATSGGILLIYTISWRMMFSYAGLLPMVPAIATLLLTGGIIIFCNYRLRKV
ncbi:wd40 repeat-containing protein [Leptolyngbya sp. Heron Island J]|uniref:TIR domain-containing protein n=1 Tax=Leptolyngbya sp. Heron Island J TaxID=1385935 RepID=UPI0003B95348|nr:TIR domain-containing protein [Leptolyngbya sp. Heron Island J]ESA35788.1 wd40 repeat-containing protein [Leptolyngbya sp. Heron Island J]